MREIGSVWKVGSMTAAHRRHDMIDVVWERLRPHLPGGEGKRGRPAHDNRRFIDAVCWILRTGAPWRDLPPDYGDWKNTHRRFCRWRDRGVWAGGTGQSESRQPDGLSLIRNYVSLFGYRLHDALPVITALLRGLPEQLPSWNAPDDQSASMLHGRHTLLLRRNRPALAVAGCHTCVTICAFIVTCALGLPHQ